MCPTVAPADSTISRPWGGVDDFRHTRTSSERARTSLRPIPTLARAKSWRRLTPRAGSRSFYTTRANWRSKPRVARLRVTPPCLVSLSPPPPPLRGAPAHTPHGQNQGGWSGVAFCAPHNTFVPAAIGTWFALAVLQLQDDLRCCCYPRRPPHHDCWCAAAAQRLLPERSCGRQGTCPTDPHACAPALDVLPVHSNAVAHTSFPKPTEEYSKLALISRSCFVLFCVTGHDARGVLADRLRARTTRRRAAVRNHVKHRRGTRLGRSITLLRPACVDQRMCGQV